MLRQFAYLFVLVTLLGCASTQVLTNPNANTERIARYALPKVFFEVEIEVKYQARQLVVPSGASIADDDPFATDEDAENALAGGGDGAPSEFVDDPSALRAVATSQGGGATLNIKAFKMIIVPSGTVDLHYDPSQFANDRLTIQLDANTLLKEVKIEADDKLGEFLVKLSELGRKIATLPTAFPASAATIEAGVVTRTITLIVDPLETGTTEIMDGAITLDITGIDRQGPPAESGAIRTSAPKPASCENQICYPILVPRILSFTGPAGVREERIVVVPDASRLAVIDLTRASFVNKTLTATFDNGVLNKVVLGKPSEALALAQVPIDILAAIIALPAELIQLKIDTSENQTKLSKQRTLEIQAQQKLLESFQKLSTADTNAPQ